MIELTEGQQRELREGGWPPRVLNPATRETLVLLPAEMFERVRACWKGKTNSPQLRKCPLWRARYSIGMSHLHGRSHE